jgi:hypothetical protein
MLPVLATQVELSTSRRGFELSFIVHGLGIDLPGLARAIEQKSAVVVGRGGSDVRVKNYRDRSIKFLFCMNPTR